MYPFSELLVGQKFAFANDIQRTGKSTHVNNMYTKTGPSSYKDKDGIDHVVDDPNVLVGRLLTRAEAERHAAERWRELREGL